MQYGSHRNHPEDGHISGRNVFVTIKQQQKYSRAPVSTDSVPAVYRGLIKIGKLKE
jgi:hypothetical protein